DLPPPYRSVGMSSLRDGAHRASASGAAQTPAHEARTGELPRGASSRPSDPSRAERHTSTTGSSPRRPSATPRAGSAAPHRSDTVAPRDPEDREPPVMKNPDVREGTEFPATVVFILIKGLKDCSDAPKVPNALRALNEALRGVDPGAFVLGTL